MIEMPFAYQYLYEFFNIIGSTIVNTITAIANAAKNYSYTPPKCFHCGRFGHMNGNCMEYKDINGNWL